MSLRLNLGCGDNRLPAPWQNHDADVDITKKLPFADNRVRFIVIEHCVEHVGYYEAIAFFKECFRVLEIGGTLRVTVPSITQVMNCGEQDYFDWLKSKGWAPTADARGAMDAILHQHGHRQAWTATLMESTLYYCGFPQPQRCELGYSSHPELRGVEGHARVIGEKFNAIESMTFEAAKFTGDLSVDYDEKFYAMHRQWEDEYVTIAGALVDNLPAFASAVDLGCGNGYIVKALRKKGVDADGVDGSEKVRTYDPTLKVADITEPMPWMPTHDLVICTEVAEHVPADRAEQLVANICAAARHTIFFSAAKSGHGGHLHLNEQPRQYWIDKFEARGFEVDSEATKCVVSALRAANKKTWWFAENCFVLRKKQQELWRTFPMNVASPIARVNIEHTEKWSQPARKIAVVLGGGERVWQDIDRAVAFCNEHDLQPTWFATNDMIEKFAGPIVAVTLHPDKIGRRWLPQRANAGYPPPVAVWSHEGGSRATNPHVTHRLKDWGGSVGLFGVAVATNLGHDRILLCGVPMTSDKHFLRGDRWTAVQVFTAAWEVHEKELRPYVRSLSGGWTEKLFGEPDDLWLNDVPREIVA